MNKRARLVTESTAADLAPHSASRTGLSRRAFVAAGLAPIEASLALGAQTAGLLVTGEARAREPAALWRAGQNDTPLRVERKGDWLVGAFSLPNGRTYDARQRVDLDSGTAVCVATRPMELFLFSGQSNAGGSPNPGDVPENRTPFAGRSWFPNHAFKTSGGATSYGDQHPRERAIDDFLAVSDHPKFGVFPQTAFLLALEALNRAEGAPGPGSAARTDWFGDQPLESFTEGHTQFDNTLVSAGALARLPARYGREARFGALVFIQGENRGTHTRESYAAALTRHFAALRHALGARTGLEAPPMLYCQINQGSRWPAPNGVELAQLDAHRVGGAAQFLVGPMYQYPLIVEGRPGDPGVIHQNSLGKMMLGETLALAYRRLVATGHFDPLRPLGADLEGDTVSIDFAVPPGARLALDRDWIKGQPSGNAGFVVEAGGRDIRVETVRIEGGRRVILRLAESPARRALVIRYALDPRPVDLKGAKLGDTRFAPSTGLLMAQTDVPSPFAARGFPVPKTIRHYCVRFRLDLA